jgi:hypothetical protein
MACTLQLLQHDLCSLSYHGPACSQQVDSWTGALTFQIQAVDASPCHGYNHCHCVWLCPSQHKQPPGTVCSARAVHHSADASQLAAAMHVCDLGAAITSGEPAAWQINLNSSSRQQLHAEGHLQGATSPAHMLLQPVANPDSLWHL